MNLFRSAQGFVDVFSIYEGACRRGRRGGAGGEGGGNYNEARPEKCIGTAALPKAHVCLSPNSLNDSSSKDLCLTLIFTRIFLLFSYSYIFRYI